MKRVAALVLTAVMVLGLFSGCGKSGGSNGKKDLVTLTASLQTIPVK